MNITRRILKRELQRASEVALDEFSANWDASHTTISQVWRRNWERATFFAFPSEIRKVIYTTNAVESLNLSLRKIIKTRGSFLINKLPFGCSIWPAEPLEEVGVRAGVRTHG